jgi:hypothetical protein
MTHWEKADLSTVHGHVNLRQCWPIRNWRRNSPRVNQCYDVYVASSPRNTTRRANTGTQIPEGQHRVDWPKLKFSHILVLRNNSRHKTHNLRKALVTLATMVQYEAWNALRRVTHTLVTHAPRHFPPVPSHTHQVPIFLAQAPSRLGTYMHKGTTCVNIAMAAQRNTHRVVSALRGQGQQQQVLRLLGQASSTTRGFAAAGVSSVASRSRNPVLLSSSITLRLKKVCMQPGLIGSFVYCPKGSAE